MTSEVVVMNRLGVALATDSAATVNNGSGGKVFNSADKLFMLSKRHPVGVMVYGNAALLGVPWETIIKMFRRHLDGTRFASLEEYGHALILYLTDNTRLFPIDVQDSHYLRAVEQAYCRLADKIDDLLYERFLENADSEDIASQVASDVIVEELGRWQEAADATCLNDGSGVRLVSRFSGEISARVAKAFSQFRIDGDATRALYDLAKLIVSKETIPAFAMSGIIVAGFGEDEHFPVMQQIQIGEVYEGKLKYRMIATERINGTKGAIVQPFADADMVNTFLHGMNPGFELRMRKEMAELVVKLPDEVVDAVTDLNDAQKAKWKEQFKPESARAVRSLFKKLDEQRTEKHLEPIRQAIANMPKDELGHAAARLVSLNWFQKRMSLTTETVGGPVDVAVISKGDGFIWIERKHYFRPELNPQFFDNYHFRPEQDGAPDVQGEAQIETNAQAPQRRAGGGSNE